MSRNEKDYRARNSRSARSGRPSVSGGSAGRPSPACANREAKPTKKPAPAKRTTTKRSGTSGASRGTSSSRKNSTSIPRVNSSSASARSAARMNASGMNKRGNATQAHAAGAQVGAAVASAAGRGVSAILASRVATIIAIVLIIFAVVGIADTVLNWNKAYGNVTVAGVEVGGMTPEEIDATLRDSLSTEVSHAQVKVYASEDAQRIGSGNMTEEERIAQIQKIAQAEQISVEQATANTQSWSTDALALKANVPYESLVKDVMAVGREDGGLFTRLALIFMPHDVTVNLEYDEASLEALASEIDRTIGDIRVDATVVIEDGVARPVEGHDGRMIDRTWFKQQLSSAFVSGQQTPSFIAIVSPAPSRISFSDAQKESDAVNKALQTGAIFSYKGTDWLADATSIGSWTRVETVDAGNGAYKLQARIDDATAIPVVVQGAGAAVKSENVKVKFAKADDGSIVVRTFGPGNIPEVTPAIHQLNSELYGENGIASTGVLSAGPVRIEIEESNAPAALSLEQAIDAGIVTVIGEYTTEFSNDEGTENRNHNIKLAADLLDNGIIEGNGGTWHFNDRTGDTNEAAGFWAAGSIVEGEYVDSIGGGICQVATTVFNAVYESGLPIDMRFPHQLYIASYPTGRDAAVSYPDLDLWWTNDLPSDVLLDMSYTDSSVTARLYSVYTGYTVESEEGQWAEGAKYGTKFEEDPSLGKDVYYTKTTGVDGSSISVTRIVKNEAGEVIIDQVFNSVYDKKDEVIVVGPGTDTSKLVRKTDDPAKTTQGGTSNAA